MNQLKPALKIKSRNKSLELSIQLKKTPDILKALAKSKKKQIVIGFALRNGEWDWRMHVMRK